MAFKDLIQTKKGDIGEQIVRDYLEKRGYNVYSTKSERAHPFDFMVYDGKEGKFIADVKTKPIRDFYPDTGVGICSYKIYLKESTERGLPFYLFFVDEKKGEVYFYDLANAEKETLIEHYGKLITYPKIEDRIIYFPVKDMKVVLKISEEQVLAIKAHQSRHSLYNSNY